MVAKRILNIVIQGIYKFRYHTAHGSVVYALALINIESDTKLPLDYVWGERYMNWIEYLKRRGEGIKCTYQDVEDEYLENWRKRFEKAYKEFEDNRNNSHDWL